MANTDRMRSSRARRGYVNAKVFASYSSETTCAGSSVSELSDLAPWDSPVQSFVQPTAPSMAPSAHEFLQAALDVAAKAPTKQCLSSLEAEKIRAKMLVRKQAEPRSRPGGKKTNTNTLAENAQQKDIMCAPLPPGLVVGDPAYSRGSKNHAQGMCRPCRSFNSPQGCPKGMSCNFCHCPHDDHAIWEVEQSIVKAAERRRCKQEALTQTGDHMCTSRSCKMDAPVLPDLRSMAAVQSLVMDEPWYVPMPRGLMASEPVAALLEGNTYSL
jgi:hypothetical protein